MFEALYHFHEWQVNNEIVGTIQDIFNLLPNLSIEEMVKAFAIKVDLSL